MTGINPLVDPANPGAFPIQLAFNTPTADFVAAPFAQAAASVPEPGTLAIFGSGLFALGAVRRRLRSKPILAR